MPNFKSVIVCAIVVVAITPAIIGPRTSAQVGEGLELCFEGAFSIEEDFVSEEEPFDGNPYISDGDLLSLDGQVCARYWELVQAFDVENDLGLDAVDIISFEEQIVAFSTELDSPHGNFRAGDLLFNNGGVIPNHALTEPFEVRYDVGLDAVHFVGDPEAILEFALNVRDTPRDEWSSDFLQEVLGDHLDILFSIEGTIGNPGDRPDILDGDILSVALGSIVQTQGDLLPSIPADPRLRGVDFGLDALTGTRERDEAMEYPTFSTELSYGDTPHQFSEGDVLAVGPSVLITNGTLMQAFPGATDTMGLDALWLEDPGSPTLGCLDDIFYVCPNDVPDLIAALNAANDEVTYPGSNTITMGAGTFTLTAANNEIGGSGDNGLPAITSTMIIIGNNSIITRDIGDFRIFGVASGGDLTLNDLAIRNGRTNNGAGGGGLLILNGGSATLNNVTVMNNSAKGGGGISNFGTLSMNEGTIVGNSATTGQGGGIVNNGTTTLDSITIVRNIAQRGGAIFVNMGTVEIRNSLILDNTATATSINPGGGGIYTRQTSTVLLDDTAFSGNTAAASGCAIWNLSPSEVTMQNNTRFAHNTCTDGGVVWSTGIVNFEDTTILTGNTQPYCSGGGTFNVGNGNTGDGNDTSCGF